VFLNRINPFAVVACAAMLCLSCGSSSRGVRGNGGTIILENLSDKCFAGSSDPWIESVNTWNEAAQDAVKNLFIEYREASIRSGTISLTASGDVNLADGVTISEVKGRLTGACVVGWWLDTAGRGPRGMCNDRCRKATVWAVACLNGYQDEAPRIMPEAFRGGIPAWLKDQPGSGSRDCAVGISGSTVKPENAVEYAIEDARQRVALQICAVGDHAFIDFLSGGTWSFADSRPTVAALAYVNGMAGTEGETVETWLDVDGVGPLGTKAVGYAMVCVPRGAVACNAE